jgi:hypothetical protein
MVVKKTLIILILVPQLSFTFFCLPLMSNVAVISASWQPTDGRQLTGVQREHHKYSRPHYGGGGGGRMGGWTSEDMCIPRGYRLYPSFSSGEEGSKVSRFHKKNNVRYNKTKLLEHGIQRGQKMYSKTYSQLSQNLLKKMFSNAKTLYKLLITTVREMCARSQKNVVLQKRRNFHENY